MPLKALIDLGDKLLCADDAAVGEIPGAVPETVNISQIKTFGPVFHSLHKPPPFIDEPPVMGKSHLCALEGELPQPEIQGKETVPVVGLGMVVQGTPPIFYGFFRNPGPDGVEVDIGQAIYESLAVINDDTLEPPGPEKPFPVVAPVVKPGKPLLDFLDEFRKAAPFPPQCRDQILGLHY